MERSVGNTGGHAPASETAPAKVGQAPPSSGWDPYEVWHTRILAPRLEHKPSPRPADHAADAPMPLRLIKSGAPDVDPKNHTSPPEQTADPNPRMDASWLSLTGLHAAWETEAAFRQQCVAAVILIPVAFWIGQTSLERLVLIGAVLAVLVVALLRSSIEATIDGIRRQHHEVLGRAAAIASSAVFVSLVLALLVWGTIGWQSLAGSGAG